MKCFVEGPNIQCLNNWGIDLHFCIMFWFGHVNIRSKGCDKGMRDDIFGIIAMCARVCVLFK